MADAFGKHDGVIGWQIDNEFGPLCYCEECRRLFQDWLMDKYGSLEALEAAWGTIFWSHTYTDWRQIPLPWTTGGVPNFSLALDFRRFHADRFVHYANGQIRSIRKFSDKPITHNLVGLWWDNFDYQKIADILDFVSFDNYPFGEIDPATIAAALDGTRGYQKKNFWVMEQMSGPGGWGEMTPSPRPDRIREWTYQAIGRGADAINYFRWRPCRFGTEQYWHGILNHDGSTNRRYAEIKRTREELTRFEDLIEGTQVKAEVAFLHDYDSRIALSYQKCNPALSYLDTLHSFYRGLFINNIPVDILSKDWDLSGYKLVVAPVHFVLTSERATLLREYVRGGGTLVMTYRSAVKDATNLVFDEPLPGLLQDVFGVQVKEYHSPAANEENMVWGAIGDISGHSARVSTWLDLLELKGAEVVAKYDGGFIHDEIAITRNQYGNGKAYYIGTQPETEFTEVLVQLIAKHAGVEFGMPTPEGVESCVRTGDGFTLTFIINHTDQIKTVPVPAPCTDLIRGKPVEGSITLDSYGVAVLK